MSGTGYLVWFVVTTVFVGIIMALGIAGAAGFFGPKERAARAAARHERRLHKQGRHGGGTVR